MSEDAQIDLLARGRQVWIPDAEHGFVPAEIAEVFQDKLEVSSEGFSTNKVLLKSKVFPANPANWKAVPDNTQLLHLNEANLLCNLKRRYSEDEIYTYTGHILLALNPYKSLPLYDEEVMRSYRGKYLGAMDPHPFAMADRAYRSMFADKTSQSIIVSGESGAGKTETAKYVMNFLALVGKNQTSDLQEKILGTNPILEAFGNAKTLRNGNSSRFGKLVKIWFDPVQGSIQVASIVTYLLERSRVAKVNEHERNFHVFYQLCAGLGAGERDRVGLTVSCEEGQESNHVASQYHYLEQGKCITANCLDDAAAFITLRQAMDRIGIDSMEQSAIFDVVAGILHLGNITFDSKEDLHDAESVSMNTGEFAVIDMNKERNEQAMKFASELLGLDSNELKKKLVSRVMFGGRGSSYTIRFNCSQAMHARDALAKHIYRRLFDYLVSRINSSLMGEVESDVTQACQFIGILDIYGFEIMADNSFEQLCINFANEKLQQFFLCDVFKQEQEMYRREAIKWQDIEYVDNGDLLSLMESKPLGVFCILDEQCVMPKATDKSFSQKVQSAFQKHSRFLRNPRTKSLDEAFTVRHFAGDVTYSTTAFLEKNMDSLPLELENLAKSSSASLLSQLMSYDQDVSSRSRRNSLTVQEDAPAVPARSNSGRNSVSLPRFKTVASRFLQQLDALMMDLQSTKPHYIRCIKPNHVQVANMLDGSFVLSQLNCSGMVEVVQLMQKGYPTRCQYSELFTRYCELLPESMRELEPRCFVEGMLMALGVNKDEYQLGLCRVFLKAGRLDFLEQLRGRGEQASEEVLQKVLSWLRRKKMQRVCFAVRSALRLNRIVQAYRAVNKMVSFVRCLVSIRRGTNTLVNRVRAKLRSTVRLQALWRGRLARMSYAKLRSGLVKLQRWALSRVVRLRYLHTCETRRMALEQAERDRLDLLAKAAEEERLRLVVAQKEEDERMEQQWQLEEIRRNERIQKELEEEAAKQRLQQQQEEELTRRLLLEQEEREAKERLLQAQEEAEQKRKEMEEEKQRVEREIAARERESQAKLDAERRAVEEEKTRIQEDFERQRAEMRRALEEERQKMVQEREIMLQQEKRRLEEEDRIRVEQRRVELEAQWEREKQERLEQEKQQFRQQEAEAKARQEEESRQREAELRKKEMELQHIKEEKARLQYEREAWERKIMEHTKSTSNGLTFSKDESFKSPKPKSKSVSNLLTPAAVAQTVATVTARTLSSQVAPSPRTKSLLTMELTSPAVSNKIEIPLVDFTPPSLSSSLPRQASVSGGHRRFDRSNTLSTPLGKAQFIVGTPNAAVSSRVNKQKTPSTCKSVLGSSLTDTSNKHLRNWVDSEKENRSANHTSSFSRDCISTVDSLEPLQFETVVDSTGIPLSSVSTACAMVREDEFMEHDMSFDSSMPSNRSSVSPVQAHTYDPSNHQRGFSSSLRAPASRLVKPGCIVNNSRRLSILSSSLSASQQQLSFAELMSAADSDPNFDPADCGRRASIRPDSAAGSKLMRPGSIVDKTRRMSICPTPLSPRNPNIEMTRSVTDASRSLSIKAPCSIKPYKEGVSIHSRNATVTSAASRSIPSRTISGFNVHK